MAMSDKRFGWYIECVEKHQMLGPRFLQLLLLRLASKFPFNTNPNFPFTARKSSCMIWKNGLYWTDVKGIDSLVEVQRDHRAVIFVTRIRKEIKSELNFYHFRSAVINEIRAVIKESFLHVDVVESILHPDSLVDDSFLSNPEPALSYFKLSNIQSALMDPESSGIVSADQVLLGDHVIEVSVSTTMDMMELLQFEPFMRLPQSVLAKMFSSNEQHTPILQESYDSICEALAAMNWDVNNLLVILRLPYSNARAATRGQSSTAVKEMKAMFQRWDARVGEERTYRELRRLFCAYSILDTLSVN